MSYWPPSGCTVAENYGGEAGETKVRLEAATDSS